MDIRGGRCVRLLRGEFSRETQYGDPVAMAQRWAAEGATRLHVVDLDGARDGVRQNAGLVRDMITAVAIPIQVGGGVRDLPAAHALLADGAERVVVGTAAVEQLDQLPAWVRSLGAERLVVGVDVRDGMVATHGWAQASHWSALEFCQALAAAGVLRVLCTDVSTDGTLEGPNVELMGHLADRGGVAVIASGGVGSLDHVSALVSTGCEGVIIGKALYDGRITLQATLEAAGLGRVHAETRAEC